MGYTLDILVTNIEHKTMELIMARASNGLKDKPRHRPELFLSFFDGATCCGRCGGLLVQDFCTDLLNSTGELDLLDCALRAVW